MATRSASAAPRVPGLQALGRLLAMLLIQLPLRAPDHRPRRIPSLSGRIPPSSSPEHLGGTRSRREYSARRVLGPGLRLWSVVASTRCRNGPVAGPTTSHCVVPRRLASMRESPGCGDFPRETRNSDQWRPERNPGGHPGGRSPGRTHGRPVRSSADCR